MLISAIMPPPKPLRDPTGHMFSIASVKSPDGSLLSDLEASSPDRIVFFVKLLTNTGMGPVVW